MTVIHVDFRPRKVRHKMTAREYREKDVRVKCDRCRQWMRYKDSQYAARRPAPHASCCTNCPPMAVCSQERCEACVQLKWDVRAYYAAREAAK